MSNAIIISIIHIMALALWAADSRVVDYFISKIQYRRSMPKVREIGDDNPFVKDSEAVVREKFAELISKNYKHGFSEMEHEYTHLNKRHKRKTKYSEMFSPEHMELKDLMHALLDGLRETKPEVYKIVMRRAFIEDSKKRRDK